MAQSPKLVKRTFEAPDEVRPAGLGTAHVVGGLGEITMMRVTLQPGWRWSNDVKPIVKTESCQAPHLNYVLSGRIHVVMDDGSEEEFGPGDLAAIPPGHDAWVVGNESLIALDVTGAGVWAKPR